MMNNNNNKQNALFGPDYIYSKNWKLNKEGLTGDYVAGLVQADGSFSAVLTRKTRGDKEYFNLSLVFTLVQSQKYKDLILEIQKMLGGVGQIYYFEKDKSVRYQVTNLSDLLTVIIPFFMKHQLRSGKLLSFLHFKYIASTMSTRAHWGNRKILLSLIVLGSHMNPLGKIGNKVKFLTPDEQKHVIENILPEGVDTSQLTESIKNFKQNALTLDFINGVFDGDGSLAVSLIKSQKEADSGGYKGRITCKFNFTIVQDVHNLSLLDEIKSYFNGEGQIYELKNSNNCFIYNTGSRSVLREIILPRLMGKKTITP